MRTRFFKEMIPAFTPALITFLVYLPSLFNGFVNFDDNHYVYDNPYIKSIGVNLLNQKVVGVLWHPLTMLSLGIDYAVWGLNPFGYHLTNVILHVFNTFLVYILAVRLIEMGTIQDGRDDRRSRLAGFITSILFGIHPVHVESVAWISERKDVLCAFFYLLTLIVYLKYASSEIRKERIRYYAVCLFLFILALLSKPMAVTLPVVLIVLDYYPLKRLRGGTFVFMEKLPFIALSILLSLITIWAHESKEALTALGRLTVADRILSAAHNYVFYIFKILSPFNLAPFYPLSKAIGLYDIRYGGSLVLIVGITIFFMMLLRKGPLMVGWVYYLITLLPVIGLIQIGEQGGADRYTYIPSVALFFMIGLWIGRLRNFSKTLAFLIISVLVILSVRAVGQIMLWRDPVTLWSHEIRLYPEVTVGYYNRAGAHYRMGNYRTAIKDYDRVIELNPGDIDAYYNRGNSYGRMGNYELAIKDYNYAIRLDPKYALAYHDLGFIYMRFNDRERGLYNYRRAAALGLRQAQDYLSGLGVSWE